MERQDGSDREFPRQVDKKGVDHMTGQRSNKLWRDKFHSWWTNQPLGIKGTLLVGGISTSVFLTVFTFEKLHTSPPPSLTALPVPGTVGLRSRTPIRPLSPISVNVSGIRSAGEPALRTAPLSSPPGPAQGMTPTPNPSDDRVPASQYPVPSPELLGRQMGALTVEVASLSEAVRRLEAENTALLRGQEWMEQTMSRNLTPRKAAGDPVRSQSSAPLADDRSASSPPPSSPVLSGWRVIGVSGTGAVLVDPYGQDHLVRKGRELLGVAVTGIDPETGAVAFSDGEVLKP